MQMYAFFLFCANFSCIFLTLCPKYGFLTSHHLCLQRICRHGLGEASFINRSPLRRFHGSPFLPFRGLVKVKIVHVFLVSVGFHLKGIDKVGGIFHLQILWQGQNVVP